ncbi:DUF2603 domain-containing protein [Helicobacter marmotae]|uniref:UPF0763 protein CQA63_08670 n=1 Tax=Helicobacter marmotae TaxID=152490 RepID=A0A3D8I1E0_9HELI|nr:DUF2603 domain-containing protein [Helicobacter marmotae]RDU58953.1 DUF2603 domain-containing protein [Helicobacter marmotae]
MKHLEQDKWLDETSENLGVLHKLKDDTMILSMERGGFSKEDLWFLSDDDGEEYVVFPKNVFSKLLMRIRDIQEERLIMMLEKDIILQMPIDFDDAMVVAKSALESLRSNDGNLPEINTSILAKDIKKKYPNLFFDIDYLRKK